MLRRKQKNAPAEAPALVEGESFGKEGGQGEEKSQRA